MTRKIVKGMWCVDEEGRVGITATDKVFTQTGHVMLDDQGNPVYKNSFHHVDQEGSTTLVTFREYDGLRQASLTEIPERRRPTPERGAHFGYV